MVVKDSAIGKSIRIKEPKANITPSTNIGQALSSLSSNVMLFITLKCFKATITAKGITIDEKTTINHVPHRVSIGNNFLKGLNTKITNRRYIGQKRKDNI